MDYSNSDLGSTQVQPSMHFGHFGIIALALVLLLGVSYMEKPQLFSFKKTSPLAQANVPHYYPYVAPPAQPEVLGASTNQGPEIIGDDGTVQPVSIGQVLAASTDGVQLSPQDIKVNQVPESPAAVTKYFSQADAIENTTIGDTAFASALASGNQDQINQYAKTLTGVRDALLKLEVPQGLIKLQQLKIIQYNSAIDMLQNFTQADQNPDTINSDLQQFMASEQALDQENTTVAQTYGSEDPDADLYINPDGSVATPPAAVLDNSSAGDSGLSADSGDPSLGLGSTDASQ